MMKDDFSEWVRTQIRLAGEELIRRSESMDLGGLDLLTDLKISIQIPTCKTDPKAMFIDFAFSAVNKTELDYLLN